MTTGIYLFETFQLDRIFIFNFLSSCTFAICEEAKVVRVTGLAELADRCGSITVKEMENIIQTLDRVSVRIFKTGSTPVLSCPQISLIYWYFI